jgi:hypothetical protein
MAEGRKKEDHYRLTLIATCILLNQMRPFSALRYESVMPEMLKASLMNIKYSDQAMKNDIKSVKS